MSLKMNLSLSLPDVDNAVQTGDPTHRRNCLQLSQLFKKLANGNLPVDRVGSCHAYGTVQFTGTAAAAQSVTINNTVVSQTGGGTADTDAASMAAAINANAVLSKLVVARAAAATDLVTIQAKKAGAAVVAYGNFINIVVQFLIVAFAIFLLVRAINRLKKSEPPPPPPG